MNTIIKRPGLHFLGLLLACAFLSCANNGQEIAQNKNKESFNAIKNPIQESEIIKISSDEFSKLIFNYKEEQIWNYENEIPCVVDFYADWCRPCLMMEPVMEKLAEEYKGKLNFYKVNVDEEAGLADFFNIQGIPYMMFCSKGKEPMVNTGSIDEETLRQYIENIL